MSDRSNGTTDEADSLDPEFVAYVSGLLTEDVMRRSAGIDWTRARAVLAIGALQRIRRLWRILFGDPWFPMRGANDEDIYQRLRSGVFAQLEGRDGYERARQLAHAALNEDLPTSDDLVTMDEEIYAFYESGFQRLEAELIRLAMTEAVDPDPRNADAFFVTYDDFLNRLEPEATKARHERARELGLLPKEPKRVEDATPNDGRGGRRSIQIEYETAQRVWWEMVDEFEEDEEPRRPNQRDFCDRLAPMGIHIADRTLRTRIDRWMKQGLAWPPSRPDDLES